MEPDPREVEYYTTRDGECPTNTFLMGLRKRDAVRVVDKLELLETYGINVRRPHVDTLRDGIHELRVNVEDGEVRLLFFFYHRDKIIITHGIHHKSRGTSKHQRIPEGEINRAIAYRTDYINRHLEG